MNTDSSKPKRGDIVIADDDMQNIFIVRPGLSNPDDSPQTPVEREHINLNTPLGPLDIVLFYDERSKYLSRKASTNRPSSSMINARSTDENSYTASRYPNCATNGKA